MPLVLAGGKGWLMDDFQSHLVELGIQQHVVLTGYVSDAELIWLYRHCYANLYPSLFEGFGLPVLEGMQFGAATVASDNTSLPEVAGNAAILLEATDIDAWAGTLVRLGADERERGRLQAAALAQAATFEWKTSAAALLRLYEDALAAPKRRQ
jgi:glycosyltransferase involved in cell wall biosynthesis